MTATMYQRKNRLTIRHQSKLIEHFVVGSTACATAEVVGVQTNTASAFSWAYANSLRVNCQAIDCAVRLRRMRVISAACARGKRGRGAGGKVAVFGLLKRGGKVYTAIIANARTETLLPIIQVKVEPDSIVYTDAFGAYNTLDG